MTDEIITELAGLAPDAFAVIARTTAMHYKATRKDIAAIARELNVDHVVEGAVRHAGESVALTVQLVRAGDQAHLWAKRYDARMSELFGVYRAVAQAVGEQLGLARSGSDPLPARRRKPTEDLTAYTLYHQGRHHVYRLDWTSAKRCFQQAIARDPRFALAYDALAELCWYQGFGGFAPPKEVSAAGMFYAARALEIDNTMAETHALLAMFKKEIDFDKGEMRHALERARELNSSSPLVRIRYAIAWLMPTCQFREAIAEIEAALESDPLAVVWRAWLGIMLWLDRQYDRAIEQARLMVEIEPASYIGHWQLGIYAQDAGLFDESIAALRTALDLSGGSTMVLGWLGLALGQSGNTSDARATLGRLHEAAAQNYVPPSAFAFTYLGLGDVDNAFLWMDRAADACDHMLTPIQSYPFLDPLRSDPRYFALLRKLKVRPFPPAAAALAT